MANKVCAKCGGELDNGYISNRDSSSTDYTTLNPKTRNDSTMLSAFACLSCGHVELSIDAEKLKNLVK